jgi:ABC-type uncharacterized transport system permease subunit
VAGGISESWSHFSPILAACGISVIALLMAPRSFSLGMPLALLTAQALTGGQINLVTIVIGSEPAEMFCNPGIGYALALGMVVIMALAITGSILQNGQNSWLR